MVNIIPPLRLHGTRLYFTGTIPALYCAMWRKMGCDRSKCSAGGSHHPPLLLGGQKLVPVTVMAPWTHHWESSTQVSVSTSSA
ncbi:hypothetical protein LINGRAHAP2_LOCUS8020 [Linum grandiflorum]